MLAIDDLSIMKALAGRPRDGLDAENLVTRQPHLDRTYSLTTLADLCELKEDLSVLEGACRLNARNAGQMAGSR